ncbi:NfeD family protein [Williamsia maris]|uniref:Membrane protein implicated in regulation of membrane protease activity n=1 Tax=Williamsia maris TaxID=72806 RepID=A0ABT1HK27_9NOCA|nr:NfeD family protein [Williamsia maris]MCP2178295.1 Membrane protein implicated in regulation of membrane protease activity [Williamsia maris]
MAALVWLAAALVLLGVEALSGELILLMLAGGALAASGSALFFDLPIAVDGVVFAVVSVLLLAAARPVAKRHLMRRPALATNAEALQGKTAVVTAEVTSRGGQVRLDGDTWSARPMHDADVYETGQDVMVMQIDGATAVVWKG